MVAYAGELASALADIIDRQHLAVTIGGRRYVRVEGWSTLAAMVGISPRTVRVTEIADGVFEAEVELIRLKDGLVVGRGIAECGAGDEQWATRPRYARKSMAITRAAGKAFRLMLSWIVTMAGYEPTPAEEMVVEGEAQDIADDPPQPQPLSANSAIGLIRSMASGSALPDARERIADTAQAAERFEKINAALDNIAVLQDTAALDAFVRYLFGKPRTDLTVAEGAALYRWALRPTAGEEAEAIMRVIAQSAEAQRVSKRLYGDEDALPSGDAAHWSANERMRKKFWATAGDLGLDNAEAHAALGVEHLADYKGTLAEALNALRAAAAGKGGK